jgi:hypothetical protein
MAILIGEELYDESLEKHFCRELGVESVYSFYDAIHDITGPTKAKVMEEVLLGATVETISLVEGSFKFLVKGNRAVILDPRIFSK